MVLSHVMGIFTHPDREWEIIRREESSKMSEFITHTPILALIPALCGYYGVTQVGWVVGASHRTFLTTESAFILCALMYVAFLAGVWILGEMINWMSNTFSDKEIPPHHGMAMAVYISTPLLLAGATGLYPMLWLSAVTTSLAGAYSAYLLYNGIPILMDIPKERGFIYASSILTVGLVMLVALMAATVVIWSVGAGPVFI